MTGAVDVGGLTKRFGKREVLKGLDIKVPDGDFFAVIGPSGVGKTTLLRILSGLLEPDAGTVSVLGRRMGAGPKCPLDLRRRMAYIPQKPMAFRETVRGNVAYPLVVRGEQDGREKADSALRSVGLLDLADAQGGTLSGGELQRMAFARATVYRPELLLLDEFTAHLDPYNIKMLEEAVTAYHRERGATVVLVTHNMFQAKRIATTTAFMLDGIIVESGETGRIFNDPSDPKTAAFVRGDMVC